MIQDAIAIFMTICLGILILGLTALVPMIVIAAYRDLMRDKK